MDALFGENITHNISHMQKCLSQIHMISSMNAVCNTVSQAVVPLCSNKEVYTGWVKYRYTVIIYIYTIYCITTFAPHCMLAASRSEKRSRESTAIGFNRFRVVRVERTENF